MEYSLHELCQLSGVSARTLRYYDEIGLLKPVRVDVTRYRYYDDTSITTLQTILFYRALRVASFRGSVIYCACLFPSRRCC